MNGLLQSAPIFGIGIAIAIGIAIGIAIAIAIGLFFMKQARPLEKKFPHVLVCVLFERQ